MSEIANQIKNSPERRQGLKWQWIAMILLCIGSLLPRVFGMNSVEVGSLRDHIVEASAPIGLTLIYVSGFIAVLGIWRAKRIATIAFCLAVTIIPLAHAAIVLRFSRSISTFDARMKVHDDYWHQYAEKYRPILKERYDLYVTSISGNQKESDEAIKKLSDSVKRPQDRGVVILEGEKGRWIFPMTDQKVRDRNIRVFKLRDDNLNWIFFGATDSFDIARKEWRSSETLLKSVPILRKGSEAEFTRTSQMRRSTAVEIIKQYSLASMIPFLYSVLISSLTIGIARAMSRLLTRRRKVL
jgi:hypothetical protein